jgi:prevent-host-death family protein
MVTASISELKNKLSAYIDRVREGETILVLDRGRPVAQLEPAVLPDDERVARLVRKGILRPAQAPPPLHLLDEPLPEAEPGVSVLEALLEERRSGR